MKKATTVLFSAAIALSLVTVSVNADRSDSNPHGPGTTEANIGSTTAVGKGFIADTTTSAAAKSTAEFEVVPGDLTLDAVPNFKFAGTSVANVIKDDVTIENAQKAITANNNHDGNDENGLSVTDYTGTSNGWNVLASLGQFTNSNKGTISGAKLTLSAADFKTDSDLSKPSDVDLDADSANDAAKPVQENNVWNAPKGSGQGLNTAIYNTTTTKLHINKQTNIQPGTYQATLYWSLVNAPSAAAVQG